MAKEEEICRICFYTEDLIYIFDEIENISISQKLMSIADVEVAKDDNLPKYMCQGCLQKVVSFTVFKAQVEKSYDILQNVRWDDKASVQFMEVETLEDVAEVDLETYGISNKKEEYLSEEIENNNPAEFVDHNTQIERITIEIAEDIPDMELNRSQINEDCTKRKARKSQQKIHQKILLFKCNICNKKYKSDFRLRCHMREHNGKLPFQCEICSKVCTTASILQDHERSHTGERPYKCSYCDKHFAQINVLSVHQRLHTGECPYKCEYCSRVFATSSHLKYHRVQHTGEKLFKCKICHKEFAAKNDLVQHEKIHTGQKMFTCDICSMGFLRSYHLRRHQLKHSGERKFKCELCEKSFAQNYDLRRHMRKHERVKIVKGNLGNL